MADELRTGETAGNTVEIRIAQRMWEELLSRMPDTGLERVRALLDVVAGRLEPEMQPMQGRQDRWFMPGLPSAPWLSRAPFEELAAALESHYDELRSEVERESASTRFRPYGLAEDEPPVPRPNFPPGWQEVKLWDGIAPTTHVLRLSAAARVLRDVLERERLMKQFTFLAMSPGTRLPPHFDRFNWLVSMHMGIVVPLGCGLRVADDIRSWEEGKCIFFDNSFQHEAWNEGDSQRIVLAVHLAHPDLTRTERQALQIILTRHLRLAAVGPGALAAWATENEH